MKPRRCRLTGSSVRLVNGEGAALLLRQEVEELTTNLRTAPSFDHLRRMLEAQRLAPSDTVLAGLIEGEDESSYGVVVTSSQDCVVFELHKDGSLIRWETVEDLEPFASDFEAASLGLALVRDGQIA